jgi:hypothetical protein
MIMISGNRLCKKSKSMFSFDSKLLILIWNYLLLIIGLLRIIIIII